MADDRWPMAVDRCVILKGAIDSGSNQLVTEPLTGTATGQPPSAIDQRSTVNKSGHRTRVKTKNKNEKQQIVMAHFRPPETFPPVVKNLLIANVIVFFAQWAFHNQGIFLELYGALWPVDSGIFRIWQLITHMFMHGNLAHLLFNMFGLWMFGRYLENFWGGKRFLQFYMVCGLIAAGAHLLLHSGEGYAVGASGAIMGVFAGFAYLFPNAPLYFMFIPIPIKAKYAIPGLMAIDLFGGIAQMPGDNIAHWAHLGGAVAGLALVMFSNKRNRKNFY
jgi:membrane associated rhomboid family serine protease